MKLRYIITMILNRFRGNFSDAMVLKEEGDLLETLGSRAEIAIVEIGSWKGGSTIRLAKETHVLVYAIDPHKGTRIHEQHHVSSTYVDFVKNVSRAGVAHRIVPFVMTSEEANKRFDWLRCDLLFIDGDHRYECVKLDFELWVPRLVVGGILVMHDVNNPEYSGPHRVWKEFVLGNPKFKVLGSVKTIGYACIGVQKMVNHTMKVYEKVLGEKK